MPVITFEDRAVAFIDLLGFKNVVNRAANDPSIMPILQQLVDTLSGAVPDLNTTVSSSVPTRLIPQHLYISDCIILSAPISDTQNPNYCGLAAVIMRTNQISNILLSKGYLIRGGISIGKAWHGQSNIIGPAYQEAYTIETTTSLPRVELSEKAWEHWRNGTYSESPMCLNYRQRYTVNTLLPEYLSTNTSTSLEDFYKQYFTEVCSQLKGPAPNSVKIKWLWFRGFLIDAANRAGIRHINFLC